MALKDVDAVVNSETTQQRLSENRIALKVYGSAK
jgi:hypothetical protein